ncbi:MAG: HDOD domain-containing protein [Proteobacteria bacterium]|nr:HDOD domain-containing protein [Pseudomonadota bacterium]MBU1708718.1 HDOD domain-containing protein [Pseudomonadota bacterium]
MENILDLIKSKQKQLPTLPVVAHNILKVANDENSSSKDLAEIIQNDPAITNKILRLANSALYGQAKQVDTITRAITVVGFNEVTSLTLGMGVFSSFDLKDVEKILKMKNLWLHSICCAFAAVEIARLARLGASEHLFLNGLMHDIGKIVFAIYMPQEYAKALQSAIDQGKPLYAVEEEHFGIDHAALAGHLMTEWNFPDNLLLPCRYHHVPSKCSAEFKIEAMVVMLANFFCHKIGVGLSGSPAVDNVKIIAKDMGLSFTDLKNASATLRKNKGKIEEFLTFMQ